MIPHDKEVIEDILAKIALTDSPEFTEYELNLIVDILIQVQAKEGISD